MVRPQAAIFANRLASVFPRGVASHPAGASSTVNPKQIAHLPPVLRDGYLHAFTNALSTVFLVASAFALAWFIRQLPLRETVASTDLADTFAGPRDTDSLDVVILPRPGATYESTAAGRATQERLRATGEQRLTDLLECWQPDQHPDLARFIERLAREYFVDDSALRGRFQAPVGAAP
ncbi:MAG: hypothetical protein ACRDK7_04585 [Solirubrobacteraceae bacterium]